MTQRFIETFEINIGQDAFRVYEPEISFRINDHIVIVKLKDFKEWINEIYNSNGNRNEKAYAAKRKIDSVFHELIHPWKILPKIPSSEDLK